MSAEFSPPVRSAPASPPPSVVRVLLLGGNGLLGSAFRRAWEGRPGWDLAELSRAELNLTRPDQIRPALEGREFDLLINAAACTQVDDAEAQPDLAMAVNARAPGLIADCCAEKGARMVHFSTDYVFDGRIPRPLTEADAACPLSAYGRSKLEGEWRVSAASSRHLILRLAWLFGPGRDAFPEWVIQQAMRHGEVRVVADKTGSPTCSADVPDWVEALLRTTEPGGLAAAGPPDPDAGVVHLVNGPACTWLEYAQGVLDIAAEAGLPLRARQATPVALSSLPGLTAPRPVHSALDTGKFTRLTGIVPRSWREAMEEHLRDR